MDAEVVRLERWDGQAPPGDPFARLKADVAAYGHLDPLETVSGLAAASGVPVGALVRYVLARWATGGSEAVLELGVSGVDHLARLVAEAEAADTDDARLTAYAGIRDVVGWLRATADEASSRPGRASAPSVAQEQERDGAAEHEAPHVREQQGEERGQETDGHDGHDEGDDETHHDPPLDPPGEWSGSSHGRVTRSLDACDDDGEHPVDRLRAWLAERLPDDAWPEHGRPVRDPFEGTAFFTAGPGLIVEDGVRPPMPVGGVIFVANNVDTVTNFTKRRALGWPHGGPERTMDTWKGIYRLLDGAGVPGARCFFTNAYVGLVLGDRAEGQHPDHRDPAFRTVCGEFLTLQLLAQRPRVVVALGAHARSFLRDAFRNELAAWGSGYRVTTMRPGDGRSILDVDLPTGDRAVVTALVHPSNYANKPHLVERWRQAPGIDIEVALLRGAVERAEALAAEAGEPGPLGDVR